MKVVVLGAGGMLGHKIFHIFNQYKADVYALVRQDKHNYLNLPFFNNPNQVIDLVDVSKREKFESTLDQIQPKWIINCVGITTRKMNHINSEQVVYLNAYLPHFLNYWCTKNNAKLIHFSTDCVFSGKDGGYKETSIVDAQDLYGMSKALGECKDSPNAITLRSSIVGREIFHKTELVEWFLSQKGKTVSGFDKVYYSGVTTNTMAKVVYKLIRHYPNLNGLFQISSPKISKYELLKIINKKFSLKINLQECSTYEADKSLIGDYFKQVTDIQIPNWEAQITELFQERKLYEHLDKITRSAA